MNPVEIKKDIFWVGINDRETDLFEGLWPIKEYGVTYNSYVVRAEKNALIDITKEHFSEPYISHLKSVIDPAKLDYLIINHMEMDHTGAIFNILDLASNATILCSAKAKEMLADIYGITEKVEAMEDGQEIDLGGKTLRFYITPFLHWPETMMTYAVEEQILFPCDAFGSYGALEESIYDDEVSNLDFYESEALRYYANIVCTFNRPVLNALKKLSTVSVSIIAPSHGLVWRGNPGHMVELYETWAGYAKNPGAMNVTLLYGTMYGFTEELVAKVKEGIESEGVSVDVFDVARTNVSYLLSSVWVSRGVMVGSPTYEGKLFPYMINTLDVISTKRMLNKKAGFFGSYSWSGGARAQFGKLCEELKWDLTHTLEFPGKARGNLYEQAYTLGVDFAKEVKAMG